MRLRSIGYAVGTTILFAAAFMYARASISQGDSYTEPLVTPLSLAAVSERTFEITTKIDHDFELVLDVEQKRLKDEPTDTDLTWQVKDGSAVVAQGSSVGKPWQNWWGTYEQRLGTFSGRAGHHYTLTLQVNRGAAQLDSADPIVKVRIPRGDWEGYGAGIAIEKLASGVLGLVGLVIIGCSFQLRRRSAGS
jgi:hypothetical protein